MPLYFASLVYSGQGASILVESVLTGEATKNKKQENIVDGKKRRKGVSKTKTKE